MARILMIVCGIFAQMLMVGEAHSRPGNSAGVEAIGQLASELRTQAGIGVDAATDWQMMGTGYKPGTQEVLFYEYHKYFLDPEGYIIGRYVEYHLPDQSLKSVKTLDYSKSPPWTPSFEYDDYEVGYQVGVDVSSSSARLYRYSEETSLEEARLPMTSLTVVDAGFDAFIQHVWTKLEQQQEVGFEVFAPLKLDSYQFSLKLVDQVDGMCHFQMALDWWPVDLFISPVKLEYDCATRRLLRYQGITNLRDRNYDQYEADIHYQWMSEYPPFRFGPE